jgi:protein TonB
MTRMRKAAYILVAMCCAACGGSDDAQDELTPDSLTTLAPTAADTALPTVVSDTSPFAYPVELWDRGVEGETELMILVSEMGEVDSAYISKASGVEPFDSAALAGARRLQFSPARTGERRIAKWIRVPIRFSREGATVGSPLDTSGG